MPCTRHLLAALVLVLSAAGCSAPDEPADDGDQTITLMSLPQIVQPGTEPAPAAEAETALALTVEPARPGRPVVLERAVQSGWEEVARAEQSEDGAAEFTAPYSRDGEVQTYRAVALEHNGLPEATSGEVSADAWGEPALSDEFSGNALPEHWALREQEYVGHRACSDSSPDAFRVAEGTLRLSALVDPDPPATVCETDDGRFDYRLTGHVATHNRRDFSYGIAAARIRLQPRRGQHSAFWLQQAEPGGAEIDVVEYFGDGHPQGGLSSFVHFTDEGGESTKVGPRGVASGSQFLEDPDRFGADWSGAFHVFSVEWTPERYVFRIDGKETFRTTEGVSDVREFLILSLQSSTYEIRHLDGNRKPPHGTEHLPQHMYVDWVRYWEN